MKPVTLTHIALTLAMIGVTGSPAAQSTAISLALPEAAQATASEHECTQWLHDAEGLLERGRQLASVKRWQEASPVLRESAALAQSTAAKCPQALARAQAVSAASSTELKNADLNSAHQNECQPRIDNALELDIRASTAKREHREPGEIERLLAETETAWRHAVAGCKSPHAEKAERYLNATIRSRSTNAELLSSGPACDSAWKNAGTLQELAKNSWKEKHWEDATILYHKAITAWEAVGEKCNGSRKLQAQKKIEQTQVDAHNAEYCGPKWENATELTQQMKNNAAVTSLVERDKQSINAEVAWRSAIALCLGAPQSVAKTNADALARERGAPLPPSAEAQISRPQHNAALISGRQPSPEPEKITKKATTAVPAADVAPPPSAKETAAAAPPPAREPGVTVAGNTTYRGKFATDKDSGSVSGEGTVDWSNGEHYAGTLVSGKREGKGRFTWASGQWYEGDWKDDVATGRGIIKFSDGKRYEGSVENSFPHGHGTLTFATGERYTGNFSQGNFNGQGTYLWNDGSRYDGNWVLGVKHGTGRQTWRDGSAWEGEFINDQQTEKGRSLPAMSQK